MGNRLILQHLMYKLAKSIHVKEKQWCISGLSVKKIQLYFIYYHKWYVIVGIRFSYTVNGKDHWTP